VITKSSNKPGIWISRNIGYTAPGFFHIPGMVITYDPKPSSSSHDSQDFLLIHSFLLCEGTIIIVSVICRQTS